MKKRLSLYLPVWLIFTVVLGVILFTVPFAHDGLFKVCAGFIFGSMLMQLITVVLSLRENNHNISTPSVVFSLFGTLIVVVLAFVLLAVKAQPWIMTVAGALLLGVNLIVVILSNGTRKRAVERDERYGKKEK